MVFPPTRLTTLFAVQAGVVTAEDCIKPGEDWLKCITTAGEYLLPEGTFILDRHFQMPDGVTIRGAGPGKTIIEAAQAVDNGCGSKIADDQHPGKPETRIGFVLGNNCVIGGFTFLAKDDHRWQDYDGAALCGGAVFETPGCADAYCEGENIGDEAHGDGGVENITISDVVISGKTDDTAPQLAVFITRTKDLENPTHDVSIKEIRMDHSWCDGINLHGAVYNAVVENCDLSFQGDDNLAVWSTDDRADNITFRNNTLSQAKTTNLGSPRWGNCVALYGGGHITVQDTTCYHSSDAVVKMSEEFLGSWGENSKVEVKNTITDDETPACTDGGPSAVLGCDNPVKTDTLPGWTQLAGHNCFEGGGATVVPPDAYAPDEGITVVACMAACASSVVPCDAVVTSVEVGQCFLRKMVDEKACEEDSDFNVWLAPGGTGPDVPEEPDDPVDPAPNVPDQPDEPESEEPVEPVDPEPDVPDQPDEPVDPVDPVPDDPVDPVPDVPDQPDEPESVEPVEPVDPEPDVPDQPDEPVDPVDPVPDYPVELSTPAPDVPVFPEPVDPFEPLPDEPFEPVDPVPAMPYVPDEPLAPEPVPDPSEPVAPEPTSCSLQEKRKDCEGKGCTWCRKFLEYKFCDEPNMECPESKGLPLLAV